jgi:hypothetical protein
MIEGRLRVELDAGNAHGMFEGDEFALYPPDKTFRGIMDYNSPLAVCRVTKVDDFVSQGLVEVDRDSVGEGAGYPVRVSCKAVQRREILKHHVLSPRTARLLPGEADVPVQSIQEAEEKVRSEGKLVRLTGSESPFFEIRVKRSGHFEIAFTHNSKTGARATVEVQSEADLLSHLAQLAIYYNLFNLGGESSSTGLSVEKTGFLPRWIKAPGPRKPGSDGPPKENGLRELLSSDPQDIYDGDTIGIRVRNTSFKSVYIEILDLEPSWQVSRVYPLNESWPIQLLPGEPVDFFITMSMSTRVPHSVQPETFDALVVLATTSDRVNFPADVLPQLDQTSSWEPPPLRETGHGCGAKGNDSEQWFVQRVDVRVVQRA